VNEPESYANVTKKWIPELKHYGKNTPLLLVGTKSDIRDDPVAIQKLPKLGKRLMTEEEGWNLAKDIRAIKYMECSALTRTGLKNVFDEAISIALFGSQNKQKKRGCTIL
jgi:GTPase SAR1 family protein